MPTGKRNNGISQELPYQCPIDPNLKFYTTLACDTKREGDQQKANAYSKQCNECLGPVLIKR